MLVRFEPSKKPVPIVLWEVPVDPVHEHPDTGPVEPVDQIAEVVRDPNRDVGAKYDGT